MRKIAFVLAVLAGLCCVAIGLWLLLGQPDFAKHWMQQWLWETGVGKTFHVDGAATVFGILTLVYAAVIFICAAMIPSRFVSAGIVLVAMDMIACVGIVLSPNPKMAVFVWGLPGLLLAGIGFLLGMELQRTQEPEGESELV